MNHNHQKEKLAPNTKTNQLRTIKIKVMRHSIIYFTLFCFVFICNGQENIVKCYCSHEFASETMLTIYPDKRYQISMSIGSDIVPRDGDSEKELILSSGIWSQKSDTLLLVDSTKTTDSIGKKYKLLMLGEKELKNLTLEHFSTNDILYLSCIINLKENYTFSGEINNGQMTGTKIDWKNNIRFTIKNGIVTDSVKFGK